MGYNTAVIKGMIMGITNIVKRDQQNNAAH